MCLLLFCFVFFIIRNIKTKCIVLGCQYSKCIASFSLLGFNSWDRVLILLHLHAHHFSCLFILAFNKATEVLPRAPVIIKHMNSYENIAPCVRLNFSYAILISHLQYEKKIFSSMNLISVVFLLKCDKYSTEC